MRISQKDYNTLTASGFRVSIHDVPHSGHIENGFQLADGAVTFEKNDFGIISYHLMSAEEYRQAQAWRPHVVTQRANGW